MNKYALLLGIGALICLVSCSNKPEKLTIAKEPDRSAAEAAESAELAQELSDVKYTHTRDGKLQWELVAGSVQQAVSGLTDLRQVKLTYYAEDGRITVLNSDFGTYETSTGDASLRGNVHVLTSDGNDLYTDALEWDQESEILTGEGDVTITRGDSILKGKGFELSPEAETLKIYEVEGTINQREMSL